MYLSRHKPRFRKKVTEKVIKSYQEWKRAEKEDDKPMYRTKDDILTSRKSLTERRDWYKSRGYKACLKMQTTPGSVLKDNISKRLWREGLSGKFNVMIQEDGGRALKYDLSKHQGNKASSQRPKCLPCLSNQNSVKKTIGNPDCWTRSCTYSITRLPCKSEGQSTQYWGKSGQSGFSRGKYHWEGLKSRSKNNILNVHAEKDHGGMKHSLSHKDFSMEIMKCHGSNLSRQIHEGLLISSQLGLHDQEIRKGVSQPRQILNSRTEFNQPGLNRPRAA